MLSAISSQNIIPKQKASFGMNPAERVKICTEFAEHSLGRPMSRGAYEASAIKDIAKGLQEKLFQVKQAVADGIWKKNGGGATSAHESNRIWGEAESRVGVALDHLTKSIEGEPVYRFATKKNPAKTDQILEPALQPINKDVRARFEQNFTGPVRSTTSEIKESVLNLLS